MHEQTEVRGRDKQSESFRQFKLLVAHLLDRFVNNEMLSVGGETLPFVMTVAGAFALPTLIAAILVFPSYHAFPPHPPVPGFWTQVCEHYFFTVYSMMAMGLVTIFEADLFFPEPLDTLILSPLPIPPARMALARVCANLIFLLLVVIGTNVFTILAYPTITELQVRRLFLANLVAVLCGAIFSAAFFLGVQGILCCVLAARHYRRASAIVQCCGTAVLFSTLLTAPKIVPLLQSLTADPRARWFPPFWFLGVYESILGGTDRLQRFATLGRVGLWATTAAIIVAVFSFPIAYVRRSRQAIEGAGVMKLGSALSRIVRPALHSTLLRTPQQRAIYHFIGQSLRSPKHRIYLAMYAGLGLALLFSAIFSVEVSHGAITFSANDRAVEAAVPAVAFWTVAGLCSALASPADPRGGWVFPVIAGAPNALQLDAVRIWVVIWTNAITLLLLLLVAAVLPAALTGKLWLGHLFTGMALGILLPDIFLFRTRTIPFTEIRIPLNTDLAWILLRYIILLPATLLLALRIEPWIIATPLNFLASLLAVLLLHSSIREAAHRGIRSQGDRCEIDHLTGILPALDLNTYSSPRCQDRGADR